MLEHGSGSTARGGGAHRVRMSGPVYSVNEDRSTLELDPTGLPSDLSTLSAINTRFTANRRDGTRDRPQRAGNVHVMCTVPSVFSRSATAFALKALLHRTPSSRINVFRYHTVSCPTCQPSHVFWGPELIDPYHVHKWTSRASAVPASSLHSLRLFYGGRLQNLI